MREETVLLQVDDGVATITLNRPEAMNALSLKLLYGLHEILQQIRFDRSVRAVIVTGAGDRAFCSGADLKERAGMTEQEARRTVMRIRETINDVAELPQPVIAAINGGAFGGGLELALACDLRIASEQAKMGLTEVSLGIIPGAGGTQRLPRLIGMGKAKELIFTARRLEAQEAWKLGVVNQVVPADQLMETARGMAREIARNAPLALIQAKRAINHGMDTDLHTGLAIEMSAYETILPTKDRLEGLAAFREKRPPVYRGE